MNTGRSNVQSFRKIKIDLNDQLYSKIITFGLG